MHPLLRLVVTQPQLLAEHAESYAALVATEIEAASQAWGRRAMLQALALCGLAVAVLLAGVAVMLWAVLPMTEARAPWALWAMPLVPGVVALGCLAAARARVEARAFEALRRQVAADLALLRELAAT